jgi:hypothetical protein
VRGLSGNTFEEKRIFSLKKQEKLDKNKDRVIVPIDFNPHMAKPGDVLRKHYNAMVKKNEHLKEVFPSPPMAALRQPPNLRRILCGSKLHPVRRAERVKRGTHKDAIFVHLPSLTVTRWWDKLTATDTLLKNLSVVKVKDVYITGNVSKPTVLTIQPVNTLA